MTISAFLLDAGSDKVPPFFVPVASERFFINVWMPAAHALQLKYVPLFQTGLDLEKADLESVLIELHKLGEWVALNNSSEVSASVHERIDLLIEALQRTFRSHGAKIFIG